MSNGIGCKCAAMCEHECACDGVNWNNAPLSGMKILELATEYRVDMVLSDAIFFARAIEKAHGIVEDK